PDPAHRGDEILSLAPVEWGEQLVEGHSLQPVEFGKGSLTVVGQPDDLPTTVAGGLLLGNQPGGGEAGQYPAEITCIKIKPTPEVGCLAIVVLREFEQHPRLGQPEGRAGQVGLQEADDAGVEAVEAADILDDAGHS